MCHPFILKISSVTQKTGYDVYSYVLTNGQFTRFSKDTLFLLLAPALVFFGKELRQIKEKYLLVILAFLFIHTNDFLKPASFYQFIMICAGATIGATIYKKADENTKEIFFKSILTSAFACCCWVFLEFAGVRPYRVWVELLENIRITSTHPPDHYTGPLNHPNLTGAYIALSVPAVLYLKRYIFLPTFAVALYLLDSALPIVTALSILGYYGYSKIVNKPNLYPFIALFIAGVFVYITGVGGLDNQRFYIWEQALKRLSFNPIIGGGLGFFGDTFHNSYPLGHHMTQHKNLHSEYLTLYTSFGLVGLIALFYALKRAVSNSSPAITAGLFGVFVNMYGNFTFHVSITALVGICYYVLCLKESREVDNV